MASSSSSLQSSVTGGIGSLILEPLRFQIEPIDESFTGLIHGADQYAPNSKQYYMFIPMDAFSKGATTFREWYDLVTDVVSRNARHLLQSWFQWWQIVGNYRDNVTHASTWNNSYPHSVVTCTAIRGLPDPSRYNLDEDEPDEKADAEEKLHYQRAVARAVHASRPVIGMIFTGSTAPFADADCVPDRIPDGDGDGDGDGGGGRGGRRGRGLNPAEQVAKQNNAKAEIKLARRRQRELAMIIEERLSRKQAETYRKLVGDSPKHTTKISGPLADTFYHKMSRIDYAEMVNIYTPDGIDGYRDSPAPGPAPSPIEPNNVFTIGNAVELAKRYGADPEYCKALNWERRNDLGRLEELRFPFDGADTYRLSHHQLDATKLERYIFPFIRPPRITSGDSNINRLMAMFCQEGLTDPDTGEPVVDLQGQARAFAIANSLQSNSSGGVNLKGFAQRCDLTKPLWTSAKVPREPEDVLTGEDEEKMDEKTKKERLEEISNKYIAKDLALQSRLRKKWVRERVDDYLLCMTPQAGISTAQAAHVKWRNEYIKKTGTFCLPREKQFSNISSFAELMAFKAAMGEIAWRLYVTHSHMIMLELVAITTPLDRKLHPHAILLGTHSTGKSNLLSIIRDKCIPGVAVVCASSSLKAELVQGNNSLEWTVYTYDEAPPAIFGLNSSSETTQRSASLAGSKDSAQTDTATMFRELFSSGEYHHKRSIKDNETGFFRKEEIHIGGNFTFIFNMNVRKTDIPANMLSRVAPASVGMYARPDEPFIQVYAKSGNAKTAMQKDQGTTWFRRDQALFAFVAYLQQRGVLNEWAQKSAVMFQVAVMALAEKRGMTNATDIRSIERANIIAIGLSFIHGNYQCLDGEHARIRPTDTWCYGRYAEQIEPYLVVTTEHMLAALTCLAAQWTDDALIDVVKAINKMKDIAPSRDLGPNAFDRLQQPHPKKGNSRSKSKCIECDKFICISGCPGNGNVSGGGRQTRVSTLAYKGSNELTDVFGWTDSGARGRITTNDERCHLLAERIIPFMENPISMTDLHRLLINFMTQETQDTIETKQADNPPSREGKEAKNSINEHKYPNGDDDSSVNEDNNDEVTTTEQKLTPVLYFFSFGGECNEVHFSSSFLKQDTTISVLDGCIQSIINLSGFSDIPYITIKSERDTPAILKMIKRSVLESHEQRKPYRCINPQYVNEEISTLISRTLATCPLSLKSGELETVEERNEFNNAFTVDNVIRKCFPDVPWHVITSDSEPTMEDISVQEHLMRCRILKLADRCQHWNPDSILLEHAFDIRVADRKAINLLKADQKRKPLVYPDDILVMMKQIRTPFEQSLEEQKSGGRGGIYASRYPMYHLMKLRGYSEEDRKQFQHIPPKEIRRSESMPSSSLSSLLQPSSSNGDSLGSAALLRRAESTPNTSKKHGDGEVEAMETLVSVRRSLESIAPSRPSSLSLSSSSSSSSSSRKGPAPLLSSPTAKRSSINTNNNGKRQISWSPEVRGGNKEHKYGGGGGENKIPIEDGDYDELPLELQAAWSSIDQEELETERRTGLKKWVNGNDPPPPPQGVRSLSSSSSSPSPGSWSASFSSKRIRVGDPPSSSSSSSSSSSPSLLSDSELAAYNAAMTAI